MTLPCGMTSLRALLLRALVGADLREILIAQAEVHALAADPTPWPVAGEWKGNEYTHNLAGQAVADARTAQIRAAHARLVAALDKVRGS